MKSQTTPQDVAREFCHSWFKNCEIEKAASLLAEDVVFIGINATELAQGKAAATQYIRQYIEEIKMAFNCQVTTTLNQTLAEDLCNLALNLTLTNANYTWDLQGFFTMAQIDSKWLVKSLHLAESGNQSGEEFYPQYLAKKTIARQQQELLNNSVSGGMMGGYIEVGFPFYFINRRMLDYLGYENEAEFVADIQGLIANCMHPEDQERVEAEVAAQLAAGPEYTVEYRMKKKDGSYIWVHDLGHKMQAEDGRAAISSVCIDITAERQAQETILNIYNNIPGAVFRCRFDPDFSVIDANDGLFEFLGYSREEFAALGNCMSAVIYPADLAVLTKKLNEQLQYGNTVRNENRLVCKDGSVKWISIKAQLFQEKEEAPHFYCVFVDITDEKRLQRKAQEQYEQELAYYSELSSTEGSIQGRFNLTLNIMESYVSTSSVADASQVGESYDAVVQRFASSAVDEGYGKEILKTLDREKVIADYAAGKNSYSFNFLRKSCNSGEFWGSTSFRTSQNPTTGHIMFFFYTVDITEKKLQEELLRQIAELDYDIITEINVTQDTHRVISCNKDLKNIIPPSGDFQKNIHLVAQEFMDKKAREEYLHKLDYDYMLQELSHKDSYTFVVEMTEDGILRVKRFQIFYINKAMGRVCMVRSDATDVVRQEQKQKAELASALAAAEQANAAKSDFLSRMSHEIRTPMNAIIGMSAIAAQAIGDDEQVAECIAKIGISSRFLLSLINDILDMSRIESGKMLLKNETVATEEFLNGVNSICYTQAAAKNVEFECIVDPMLDDYYIVDAMKLQQVLINILSNAIKFTSEGGKVTFSAAQRKKEKNGATLRFIVNDTGVGINEEFLPQIFKPFSQESTGTTSLYGGTGLGLAISKSIVDMMDGNITVRSIKGVGTEFTIDVKVGITEEEKLRRRQQKQNYNFSHLKTLVVDDDVAVCESAIVTLREMGVTAEWVDSGSKAVNRVQTMWDKGKLFDMILIDWKMPEMDGIETARRIRAIVGPEVTIIIITAYDWLSIEHEAKLAGVNLLMSKPMFKSTLVSAFSQALGRKEEEIQREKERDMDYDFQSKRILLAEDNAINTEVATLLLESKGFQVETAENGLRAMEMFSKTNPGYYSAILMDIRMPLMDGLTAATNIRHLSNDDAKTIPIIAMTANAFDDDIEKSKAAGMNAHLAKPIDPGKLYQTLYDFIFRKEPEDNGGIQKSF